MSHPTCFEAITEVDLAMRESLGHNVPYFMLGGIATAALAESTTFIDPVENHIYATDYGDISTIRPAGTKRDIDILVGDALDQDSAKKVKEVIEDAVDNELEVSIFGFGVHNPDITPAQAIQLAGKSWTSRRTIDAHATVYLELYPLIRKLDPAVFEPWTLVTPNQDHISVMHPAAHVLNYATRSISGLRHKDREKVARAAQLVFEDGRFVDDITDGSLRSLGEFAVMLDWLRDGSLKVGSRYLRSGVTEVEVAIARAKAIALKEVESHPAVVDLALHGPIQRILKPFIGNA